MKRRIAVFTIIALLAFAYVTQISEMLRYPEQINITKGSNKELNTVFPFTVKVLDDEQNVLESSKSYKQARKLNMKNNYKFKSVNNGIAKLGINLFGHVQVKKVDLNVVEERHLVPGGEALGVKLNMKGVLVVGTSEIEGTDGKKYNPALDSGIKVGDSITYINNVKVRDAQNVIDILNKVGNKNVKIVIERDGKQIETELTPVKSKQDKSYRLGIWVRDKTAGIGTLTFFDEESKTFGALGHSITDNDTGKLMNAENGEIMKAQISSIEQGEKGNPGEIRGVFFESKDILGDIKSNTNSGIYGNINIKAIDKSKKSFPIALQNEVKIGKAYILSTIEGDKIEEYEVEVVKVEKQHSSETKSMVIQVTDKNLLNKTGGIVRGMSGSPIIQNGKIIGAVTHVFINDPTKGYGIFIEWMLEEADKLYKEQ